MPATEDIVAAGPTASVAVYEDHFVVHYVPQKEVVFLAAKGWHLRMKGLHHPQVVDISKYTNLNQVFKDRRDVLAIHCLSSGLTLWPPKRKQCRFLKNKLAATKHGVNNMVKA